MKSKQTYDEIIGDDEDFKQNLLSRAQISILLNSYNDIFSSFDPRPFSHKALSDDFLIESKKAALDKEGALEISFLIPKKQRNFEHEIVIKKRLREHFKKHSSVLEQEIKKIKKRGVILAIGGMLMLLVAAVISYYGGHSLSSSLFLVLLEPAGWFLFWIGGEKIVYETKDKNPDLEFYKKMNQAEMTFHAY